MLDMNAFMEVLHSVQEIAKVSPKEMDKETALSYFKGMELSEEQKEMIYQFLQLPEEVRNPKVEEEPKEEEKEEEAAAGEEAEKEAYSHFQLYLDEVEEIPEWDAKKKEDCYNRLLQGDAAVIETISMQWLQRVVYIASEYDSDNCYPDDLVQEGNIGLLMGLQELLGQQEEKNVDAKLEHSIRAALMEYVGGELEGALSIMKNSKE